VFISNATVICSLGHGLCIFTAVPGSAQLCMSPQSLHRVPALAGGKGGDATSARWQITLCDLIWHASSCSGVTMLHCELLYPYTLLYFITIV